ncbi:MAG: alkanesulfonate monooxygenase [Cyclobacteriaceae bacterium]|jgi:alkanesulfonate monooxygenase
MSDITARSAAMKAAEVSWFAPICDGDDRYLGARDDQYKSSWKNTSSILLKADQHGFDNILCPSSYQVGQDTLTFAAGVAPMTEQISLLTAIRTGEIHPPMLARALATLDHMLAGRLTINIISSNLPGTELPSADRYQKSREVIEILKQAWTQNHIDFSGQFYQFSLPSAPVKPFQQNGGPLLYFGGYSPDGVDLCAEHCDVYLMWPDTEDKLHAHMSNMSQKAAAYGRQVDFGLRVHVIVRETQEAAHQAAEQLMEKLDAAKGQEIKNRALDAKSYGVSLQNELRETSDTLGYAEPLLWTRIGEARSGCGAALVGSSDQIVEKIQRYMDMGIRSFIFSGYPHLEACDWFGTLVLPRLKTGKLASFQNRIPMHEPMTPLAAGKRN